MDVALPYQLLQHGTPLEAQASKRAKRDVRDSPTQCDIDKHSSDHPGLSGSDASSSSETGSTVDDMEELRESYSSLQALIQLR